MLSRGSDVCAEADWCNGYVGGAGTLLPSNVACVRSVGLSCPEWPLGGTEIPSRGREEKHVMSRSTKGRNLRACICLVPDWD